MGAAGSIKPISKMTARDVTTDLDLSRPDLLRLLEMSAKVKASPARYAKTLSGRYLSLLFEKPSLRTRLTFELAIKQLGGDAVTSIGPIGDREPLKDIARNLDRWTHAIVARTFKQETVDQLAHWSSVPVINALTDMYHPCQALADAFTLHERFGRLEGVKLAFVGDGNNVAHSLMLNASRLGMDFALATPAGYEANASVIEQARRFAAETGAAITTTNNVREAVSGANAIYTDVWASMGQEGEAETRNKSFKPYQVNELLFEDTRPDAVFMHCLPAKRGLEVNDSVMESPRSIVFDQAENRLHAQKALLMLLLG